MLEKGYVYEGVDPVGKVQEVISNAAFLPDRYEITSHSEQYGDLLVTTIVVEMLLMWRTNSSSSLTITLVTDRYHIDGFIVASGAGQGLANISWGSYKKIMKQADEMLTSLAFKPIETQKEA